MGCNVRGYFGQVSIIVVQTVVAPQYNTCSHYYCTNTLLVSLELYEVWGLFLGEALSCACCG